VAGVITLDSGITYEINGTITLANKINLNGCTVFGSDRINDKLVYTPTSGELFTGAKGGNLYGLTVSATGVGSKVFNLDATGNPTSSLLLEYVYVLNSDNVGLIKGFAYVELQTIAFSNNTNGVTYQNLGMFIGINDFWIADNHNTYETFVGAFGAINILAGQKSILSYFSAKGLDISGITSIGDGASIKSSMFLGDGTYVAGSFSNKWEVEAYGLNTEKDDAAVGDVYISTPAATSFAAMNTPTKILGATTSTNLFRVSSPQSNRLTYSGTKTKTFVAVCTMSFTSAGSNKIYSCYLAKNGVILPESKQSRKTTAGADQAPLALSCAVSMGLNDYLEVWVENNTDAISMTVITLNLAIK
jgi:hypothetical protein